MTADDAELDYRACAAAGLAGLQGWYQPLTGLWRGAAWWQSANALTALIGYCRGTGDRTHEAVVARTFRLASLGHRGFLDKFYDDNGWWALAWVAAYDLTRDGRYLGAAERIFARNVQGWDDSCGGGLWWNTDRKYKNAITNELFLTLAARLSQRTADPGGTYRSWALRAWDWFRSSGMIGETGLVNDGLTVGCANNGETTWTYNQGVILGGLTAIYGLTGDRGFLEAGEPIADAALARLTTQPAPPAGPPGPPGPPGILVEPSERPGATYGDDTQFKGIFVRNLHDFHTATGRPAYREFILRNARSIWEHDRNAEDQFGMHWAGPFDQAGASVQSSALDALNAAAALTSGSDRPAPGRPAPGA